MADLKLDIIVVPTYSTLSLGVMDASTYPDSPPISSPSIRITVPGFGDTTLPFDINSFNIYNSGNLGITEVGVDQPLPDGIYRLRYSVAPAYLNFVERTIMRTEKIQERYNQPLKS